MDAAFVGVVPLFRLTPMFQVGMAVIRRKNGHGVVGQPCLVKRRQDTLKLLVVAHEQRIVVTAKPVPIAVDPIDEPTWPGRTHKRVAITTQGIRCGRQIFGVGWARWNPCGHLRMDLGDSQGPILRDIGSIVWIHQVYNDAKRLTSFLLTLFVTVLVQELHDIVGDVWITQTPRIARIQAMRIVTDG